VRRMSQFAGWATPTQSCNHKNETVQLPTKAIIVRFVSVLIYRCIDVCRTFYLFEFCWCLDLVSARAGFGWERRWRRTSFKTTCCSHNTTMLCWTSCRTERVFLLRPIRCIVRFSCSCSVALLPFECTRCSFFLSLCFLCLCALLSGLLSNYICSLSLLLFVQPCCRFQLSS
jgi:hypothetical protein